MTYREKCRMTIEELLAMRMTNKKRRKAAIKCARVWSRAIRLGLIWDKHTNMFFEPEFVSFIPTDTYRKSGKYYRNAVRKENVRV